ncbi:MAG: hypothetical protein GF404_02495 [candidate division Zixibacteria bacterium]|nr:hypothetical protein [candidate division Zixibacteria bacterium]
MTTVDKNTKLEKEIERLEAEYKQAVREAMFDRRRQDRVYKQLKKKRKQLKELMGE